MQHVGTGDHAPPSFVFLNFLNFNNTVWVSAPETIPSGGSFAWRQSNKIFRMGSKKFFGLSCSFLWRFAPWFDGLAQGLASTSLAPKQVHAQAAQDARVAIFANLMAHLIHADPSR